MAVLIQKVGGIKEALGRKKAQYERFPDVKITFTAVYARKIHESVEMKWRGRPRPVRLGGVYWGPAGEAKFLERTSRRAQADGSLRRTIQRVMRAGGSLRQASIEASLFILRESRVRVPRITGHLAESGRVVSGSQVYK